MEKHRRKGFEMIKKNHEMYVRPAHPSYNIEHIYTNTTFIFDLRDNAKNKCLRVSL